MVKALRALVLSLAALSSACTTTTATVTTTPQPPKVTGIPVPFPPPPARVEVIPLPQSQTCRWRDGYWEFRGAEWQWHRGAWLGTPTEHCAYAAPSTHFESTPAGTALVYRASAWFDADTGASCVEPPECANNGEDSPAP